MISSWAPTRRRSTTQSREPGTRCARVCSPSTVEGLGHVSVELGAAAGTSGPSLTPAASPKGLSTRPTRPHDYPTKRCTRVLIFAPPARRLRFEQLQGVGQPTAPVAPLQSTKKGTGKLAARRKWRPLARFGSMTRGSSGGATQIRQARGGIKNCEVMWYMGLKKGPLNGLLWVFRVFLLLGALLVTLVGYYPLDMDHTSTGGRFLLLNHWAPTLPSVVLLPHWSHLAPYSLRL